MIILLFFLENHTKKHDTSEMLARFNTMFRTALPELYNYFEEEEIDANEWYMATCVVQSNLFIYWKGVTVAFAPVVKGTTFALCFTAMGHVLFCTRTIRLACFRLPRYFIFPHFQETLKFCYFTFSNP